jgi:hypothetical protein
VVAKLDAAPYDDELSDDDLRAVREARDEPGPCGGSAGAIASGSV